MPSLSTVTSVGELLNLVETVADVENSDALCFQSVNDCKKRRDFFVGEDGRRLIEDDDTVIVEQGPGNLHQLFVGERDTSNFRLRVDIATKIGQFGCSRFVHGSVVN